MSRGPSKKKKYLVIVIAVILLPVTAFLGKQFYDSTAGSEPSTSVKEAFVKLSTLPYLKGIYKPPIKDGVIKANETKFYEGLNLYISNHKPKAFLMDMAGKELYSWQFEFKDAFPESEETNEWYNQKSWRDYWRRVHLFDNGDLLAIYEGNGIIKIDKDSNLIWATSGGFHHDLEVVGDKIYVLNRRLVNFPEINRKQPVLEDMITILSSDRKIVKNISIVELFRNSKFSGLMRGMPAAGDIFHTNTIEILDGRLARKSPIFKRGNALISMRMLDTIAIVDLVAEKIVWAKRPGIWKTQHQPTMLDNGNMLVFNNLYIAKREDKTEADKLRKTNGYILAKKKIYNDNKSSVIEFNPLTMEIVWEYVGGEDDKFFSFSSGTCQRLPNGNTLITESTRGRVFEVTPGGEIVWEFINPHRTGKNGGLISGIQELVRIKPGPNFFLNVNET